MYTYRGEKCLPILALNDHHNCLQYWLDEVTLKPDLIPRDNKLLFWIQTKLYQRYFAKPIPPFDNSAADNLEKQLCTNMDFFGNNNIIGEKI